MALTPISDDLNIIAALPDEPNDIGGLSAAQLKAKFDEAALTIQTYYNAMISALTGSGGAGEIGALLPDGVTVDDVQGALDYIHSEIAGVTLGQIPDGTITDVKLATPPYTKVESLSDATRALLGLGAGTTPDDALAEIAGEISSLDLAKLEMEFGTYVGTGVYGSSNPNSITFTKPPRLIWIYALSNYSMLNPNPDIGRTLINTAWLTTTYQAHTGAYDKNVNDSITDMGKISADGLTFSWYTYGSNASAATQLNTSGTTYYWLAIE